MDVLVAGHPAPQPFRGDNDVFPLSIEELIGSDLTDGVAGSASPIVVRFQGARAVKGGRGLLRRGARRPRLAHSPRVVDRLGFVTPAELNGYWDVLGPAEAARREPNMVRFQVVFDRTTGDVPTTFEGITNLWIRAQPD